MRTLNLGILAHVDAGKTSLTERLLFEAGVIDTIGRVDAGNTQTDTLALERQRGITIKSAVVSFELGGITVNLIDTPGHPDFIAEVERVLSVLDGAVLVVSAVEGVQAQTRILMRALQRLRIPTLIFVNKIDRGGADNARTLAAIADRLTQSILPMVTAKNPGSRAAGVVPLDGNTPQFRERMTELLAEHDDAILADFVSGTGISYADLRQALAAKTADALVHPVYLGSAMTGAGIPELIDGIVELLPSAEGDADGPLSALVFKVERGQFGEKVALVRMVSGTIHARDRLDLPRSGEGKVTAISTFDRGISARGSSLRAGQIGKLWGLADIRIGDAIGIVPAARRHHFAPPTLETRVLPGPETDRNALWTALSQLAEQDPLINLRKDEDQHAIYVSLFGEVQKEVIQQTLALDYGLDVGFGETRVICIERPLGSGSALQLLFKAPNPYLATIGIRIEPGAEDSGVTYRLAARFGEMPIAFYEAMEETIHTTLQHGLRGWRVTDCIVTVTDAAHKAPMSTAGDFRSLTPIVLVDALREAGTVVCEPVHSFRLDLPADTLVAAQNALGRHEALLRPPEVVGNACILTGEVAATHLRALQLALPGITHGEGVLETAFAAYRPLRGTG